jgi:hypothetical protein
MHNYKDQIKESGTKAGSLIGDVEYRRAKVVKYRPMV